MLNPMYVKYDDQKSTPLSFHQDVATYKYCYYYLAYSSLNTNSSVATVQI